MKISARNVIKGKVNKVTACMVNDEVIIEIPGGDEIVSVITKSSVEKLGVAPGKEVYAIIKATNVMIGTD